MPEPQLPIFLDEHGDITAFHSVLDAERYVEPIDVNHHEYIGYDAKGYRLQLSATKDTVTITLPDNSELRAADLEQALRSWLLALGDSVSLDTKLNLSVLVNYCAARAAIRWPFSSFGLYKKRPLADTQLRTPPNKRVQPTPLRVERDRRYFMCYHVSKAFLVYHCGAANAQPVGWHYAILDENTLLTLHRLL